MKLKNLADLNNLPKVDQESLGTGKIEPKSVVQKKRPNVNPTPTRLKILQWNIQDGGGGQNRSPIFKCIYDKLVGEFEPDIVLLNEFSCQNVVAVCPRFYQRNYYQSWQIGKKNSAVLTNNQHYIGKFSVCSTHKDGHMKLKFGKMDYNIYFVHKPVGWNPNANNKKFFDTLTEPFIAIGDWNYNIQPAPNCIPNKYLTSATQSVTQKSREISVAQVNCGYQCTIGNEIQITNRTYENDNNKTWIDFFVAGKCTSCDFKITHFDTFEIYPFKPSDHIPILLEVTFP